MPSPTPLEGEHHGEAAEAGPGEHREDGGREEVAGYVYMYARQFSYFPSTVCLEAGSRYRLVLMSIDVVHGASIQLGDHSLMVRLPRGVPVELELEFDEPGEYMVYCSYYCGIGHPYMSAKIIVEP